ncbi:MAG: RNA-binding protein [Rhodospirillaceae bacterium]|nr:RNA-binding protein [Rhodospirillaceae bacterium]
MPHDDKTARQCIVSGETHPVSEMVRFVVGPDEEIVADVAGRLPGRGLWLSAKRDMIETAAAKRLFSKAAHRPVRVSETLADTVSELLKRRCLDTLGLARRAGLTAVGADKVRAQAASGQTAVLVEAADGSKGERDKMVACARGAKVVDVFNRHEIGAALGRDEAVHVGLTSGGLTTVFLTEVARYDGVRSRSVVP